MKDIIALLWLVCISGLAIYLHVRNSLPKISMTILFALAIFGGLAISNYDLITRFEGLGLKVDTARKEIDIAKSNALSEIKKEVSEQKKSIEMLITTGNDLNLKLENQKKVVSKMIEKAEFLESQLKDDQKKLEYLKDQVVIAHGNSQTIFNAMKELSVIITRITYIQGQTKSEFGGGHRLQKAAEIIEKDLNRILVLMIPNPQERNEFIQELTTSLPKRLD